MHELSVSTAIVDAVIRHAEGRPVTAVTLRIGRLRNVVPESLAFYFEIVSRGTLCEGARLEQIVVPGRIRCSVCEGEGEIVAPVFRCAVCGATDISVVSGEELLVESIEIEEEDTPCTASG